MFSTASSVVFRNVLRKRQPEVLAAVRSGFAVEEHVTELAANLDEKQRVAGFPELAPFARCTHVDAVDVQRMQGSHVLLESISKQVSFFPVPSAAKPLVLRFSFKLERSCSHLLDLDDYDAHIIDDTTGATVLRASEGVATQGDRTSLDALVDAWCTEHPQGADARRAARWYLAAVLSHPSDHAFDLISEELGV